jgi:carotenoid cleavage dioxygenase-like enzyme
LPASAGFVFHHFGGFDDGDAIVVDSLRMDRFDGCS